MFCWVRLNTDESESFSSKIDIVDVVEWVLLEAWFEEIFDDISSIVSSFSFSILEKSRSCKSADNLLDDINLTEEIDESDENDERNWWKRESNDKVENERNELSWFFERDVMREIDETIFFCVVMLFWRLSSRFDSRLAEIEFERFWLVMSENDSAKSNCELVTLERIDPRKSKFRWMSSWSDWMLYCRKTIENALAKYSSERTAFVFEHMSVSDELIVDTVKNRVMKSSLKFVKWENWKKWTSD
jgi:hypothetical protein